MIGNRTTLQAIKTLNKLSEKLNREAGQPITISTKDAQTMENAVRLLAGVQQQYFLMPRDVREYYFREELLPDGVRMCAEPEA